MIELAELTGDVTMFEVQIGSADSRHAWSLGAAEQLVLQALVRSRGCELRSRSVRSMAVLPSAGRVVPRDGNVWTT